MPNNVRWFPQMSGGPLTFQFFWHVRGNFLNSPDMPSNVREFPDIPKQFLTFSCTQKMIWIPLTCLTMWHFSALSVWSSAKWSSVCMHHADKKCPENTSCVHAWVRTMALLCMNGTGRSSQWFLAMFSCLPFFTFWDWWVEEKTWHTVAPHELLCPVKKCAHFVLTKVLHCNCSAQFFQLENLDEKLRNCNHSDKQCQFLMLCNKFPANTIHLWCKEASTVKND